MAEDDGIVTLVSTPVGGGLFAELKCLRMYIYVCVCTVNLNAYMSVYVCRSCCFDSCYALIQSSFFICIVSVMISVFMCYLMHYFARLREKWIRL